MLTPEEINREITKKGAKWTAGETWVSKLSEEERKKLLGLIPEKIPPEERVKPRYYAYAPHTFDWRNIDGKNFVTGIRNQGGCGSCWAFGCIAAAESQVNIIRDQPDYLDNLSEQFLLSCSSGDCGGWYISSTLDWLKVGVRMSEEAPMAGAPDEECFEYEANDSIPCSNVCDDYVNTLGYISGWNWVSEDTEAIKNFLMEAPLPAGFAVYEDFFGYTGGVYEHVTGELAGYHAPTIIGWNDGDSETPGHWICKNEWGSNWGEDGFFRIKYGDSEINDMVARTKSSGYGFGSLTLNTNPQGADAYIEGQMIGKTPLTIPNVATYPITVKLVMDDKEYEETILVNKDREAELSYNFSSARMGGNVLMGVLALGVLTTVVGSRIR